VRRITQHAAIRWGITILFSAVIVVLAWRTLDFGLVWDTIRQGQWAYLLPSTLLNVLTVGTIVRRWQHLLAFRAKFLHCLAANQIGAYLNTLLPLRLGDLTRAMVLRRHNPDITMVAILSSIGAELTFDMGVLMILLGMLVMVLPLPPLLANAGGVLAVLTAIAVISILLLARQPHTIQSRILPILDRVLPEQLYSIVVALFDRLQDGVQSLRSNRTVAIVFSYTALGYIIQIVSNWLLMLVFLPNAGLDLGLVALVGAGLGLAVPLLPGAAGTYELAITLLLAAVGVQAEIAAAFALTLHGQQVAMTLLMGSGFMLYEGISVQEARNLAPQQENM